MTALQIHLNGPRAQRPFVGIDCALWPPERLGGMLLDPDAADGQEGARAPDGLRRAARGGTLFVHDAYALPADVQQELRRLLEAPATPGASGARGAARHSVRWIFDSSVELAPIVARRGFHAPLHARIAARRIARCRRCANAATT